MIANHLYCLCHSEYSTIQCYRVSKFSKSWAPVTLTLAVGLPRTCKGLMLVVGYGDRNRWYTYPSSNPRSPLLCQWYIPDPFRIVHLEHAIFLEHCSKGLQKRLILSFADPSTAVVVYSWLGRSPGQRPTRAEEAATRIRGATAAISGKARFKVKKISWKKKQL